MRTRRVVRAVAVGCAVAVFSGIGVSPASGSAGTTATGASGTSTHAAGSLPPLTGYYLATSDGGVFAFGDARFHGSMAGRPLAAPVVDIEATPTMDGYLSSTEGYWLAGADGGVFAFGNARFHGSMADRPLSAPIVAIASTPTSEGYWLLAADGQVFAFGDAEPFLSPLKGLGSPVVDLDLTGIGPTPTVADAAEFAQSADYDRGSWGALVVNSAGATMIPSGESEFEVKNPPFGTLANPIVAVVTLNRSTFWLAAGDGGVFTLPYSKDGGEIVGSLKFYGSMGGKPLNARVVDIVGTPVRDGYLLAAADGGVFAFGNAPFLGSMAGKPLNAPVVGMS